MISRINNINPTKKSTILVIRRLNESDWSNPSFSDCGIWSLHARDICPNVTAYQVAYSSSSRYSHCTLAASVIWNSWAYSS